MIDQSKINKLSNINESLSGKTVLVRCDFNTALDDSGNVIDDLRIRKTLPTISFLREKGAKIVLISHIENKNGFGLESVFKYIQNKYGDIVGDIKFVSEPYAESLNSENENVAQVKNTIASMSDGQVVLFENLRNGKGEKENSIEFAKYLVDITKADMYVNDAFAVSHRAHASVVALPSLFDTNSRYAGIQMSNEIVHLSEALKPEKPFIFILGGAKFDTKLPLIQKFSDGEKSADHIVLGGALLNDVMKAKGMEVGKSYVSDKEIDMSQIISNTKIIMPTDVVVSKNGIDESSIKNISNVEGDEAVYDVGPSITEEVKNVFENAKFVLWNGPMGNYENGYKAQTLSIAKLVMDYTSGGKLKAVIGGGDTTAAMAELGLDDMDQNKNLFVSTGGGAMLEFLLSESLPGIDALIQ
jgi:phosphoglycerate kinase